MMAMNFGFSTNRQLLHHVPKHYQLKEDSLYIMKLSSITVNDSEKLTLQEVQHSLLSI
jgi:hypothetical protein